MYHGCPVQNTDVNSDGPYFNLNILFTGGCMEENDSVDFNKIVDVNTRLLI